jgi:nitroimidazol reductase NimA-like FMN-containing flavoprotein (pyridoxamine 5'-phosphate oxidase superfamily)
MVEMRRSDRRLNEEQTRDILRQGVYGVLSTVGADGQPYGVPLSYVLMEDGRIYFHCAQTGRKLDHIAHEARVSFCVVGTAEACLERGDNFTTRYASAIVFGRASAVEDDERRREILLALAGKYLPQHLAAAPGSIARSLSRTAVYALTIDEMTGKAKT